MTKAAGTGASRTSPSVPSSHGRLTPTVISPSDGWESLDIEELWRYRHLVGTFLWRQVKLQHRQTLLGPLWMVLAPLSNMVIFSLVLGRMAQLPSNGVPYALFTYAALLPWGLFVGAMERTTTSLVTYMSLISKTYFPLLTIPLAVTLSVLVDFVISVVILFGIAGFYGFPLTWRLLLLPGLMLIAMGLGMAIGMLIAPLHVRYRDMGRFLSYLIRLWFLLTPVAYAADLVQQRLPESLQWLYGLNPMYGVVEGFRWALLDAGAAPGGTVIITGLAICALVLLSALYFCRSTHSIVDVL